MPRPRSLALQVGDRGCLGLVDTQPGQVDLVVRGVDRRALAGERLPLPVGRRLDRADDRQVEDLGELPVALVLARDGHDRAGAVIGQHVVGGVHRDPGAGQRVRRVHAQEDTGLGPVGGQPVDVGGPANLLPVGLEVTPMLVGDQFGGQRRIGRDDHEGRAEQGVRAGGVDGQRLLAALDDEVHVGALGPPDPVALGGDDPLGPRRRQVVQLVQQLLGVVGDLEVPLGQLALGDFGAAPVAHAADDLLVGQHGLVVGAPVDRAVLPVGQPALPELQEQPLGPAVVLRVAGVERARPVEGAGVVVERLPLGLDVGVSEGRRVRVVADRGVLRRQPERVEPHRVQHLVALVPPVARDHVVQCHHLGVTHVQVAAGVGEHRQRVALLPLRVVVGTELVQVVPDLAPLLLHGVDVVRRPLLLWLWLLRRLRSNRLEVLAHRRLHHVGGWIQRTKKPLVHEGQPHRGVRTDAAR